MLLTSINLTGNHNHASFDIVHKPVPSPLSRRNRRVCTSTTRVSSTPGVVLHSVSIFSGRKKDYDKNRSRVGVTRNVFFSTISSFTILNTFVITVSGGLTIVYTGTSGSSRFHLSVSFTQPKVTFVFYPRPSVPTGVFTLCPSVFRLFVVGRTVSHTTSINIPSPPRLFTGP